MTAPHGPIASPPAGTAAPALPPLLAQILHNSPVAVALTRQADGVIVDVNQAWCALTGYSLAQAQGRTTVQLGFWADDDQRRQALQPLQQGPTVQHPEGAMHTRDGRWVVTTMHGARLDIDGQAYILVYLVDETERAQAQAALQQANTDLEHRVAQRTSELARARDQAQSASRHKSAFLTGMSHELRTPLNAILGFGRLLQMGPTDHLPARERGYVDQIVRAGDHLLTLIDDVLDLARVEAGQLQVALAPVALGPLVDECLAMVGPIAQLQQVLLPPAAAGGLAHWLQADRVRLKQVLLNLLSNAIKYNRRGGSVALACHRAGDHLHIEVIDTGPGLNPAQQARLFQDFERLDNHPSGTAGTGIGLALSRRLMGLMHGQIGVHSEPGAGSRFWLQLPLAAAPART